MNSSGRVSGRLPPLHKRQQPSPIGPLRVVRQRPDDVHPAPPGSIPGLPPEHGVDIELRTVIPDGDSETIGKRGDFDLDRQLRILAVAMDDGVGDGFVDTEGEVIGGVGLEPVIRGEFAGFET